MALTKLQFEDSPEMKEQKGKLYQHAMLQIYARILTKRDIIRELGLALKKIGMPTERIAATIASELIHPDVFPEGSKTETKNSKGEREDISGRPNPEAGKSMVHPDYARRNLPEFMKNYSQWRGKENLDEQMEKKKQAGRTTKGKKINYVRKKASIVDYEHEVKKKIAEMEESESDKKKEQQASSGSTRENLKEEDGQKINSTSTKEPSESTTPTNKRKRVAKQKQKPKTPEPQIIEPVVEEEEPDDEIAKVVVDNKLLPSLQTDENAERAHILEKDNIQLQSNLTKLTEMYDQLLAAFKAVSTPFKERKWVSVTVGNKDYIVGVSYKCDPTTRRLSKKEFESETKMLAIDTYKADFQGWKKYTNGRMSIDLIDESPQSASTSST